MNLQEAMQEALKKYVRNVEHQTEFFLKLIIKPDFHQNNEPIQLDELLKTHLLARTQIG